MSIDEVVRDIFHYYKGPEDIPPFEDQLDQLVRLAVFKLAEHTDQAKKILSAVPAEKYTNYLVGALGALGDSERRFLAYELLQDQGASGIITRPLAVALANPERKFFAIKLFEDYGVSRITVEPLIGALHNPDRRDLASELLIGYGEEALQYIRDPDPGSKIYKPLTNVIETIKRNAA